jgi:acetyl-CoA carboxylase biotin carboxyl carrier protein
MNDQKKQQPAHSDNKQDNPEQTSENAVRERKKRRRHTAPQRPLDESVNMDELREIVELIAEHGFTDFELENKDVRVRLRRELAPQIVSMPSHSPSSPDPQKSDEAGTVRETAVANVGKSITASTPAAVDEAGIAASAEDDLHMIPSPIVGTFFRAPSPNADPFVRLGSPVSSDTVVCIIEAMKLMNEIQAETSGVVAKIYVENGQPVEYGQPLFGIKK